MIFFSAGAEISKKFAHIAASNGAIVIDNSSAFRMNPEVPLIVPEINSKDIKKIRNGIVANPNCTTVISLMAIKPLHSLSRIDRVVATSFQSVSGAGARGMEELVSNTKNLLHNGKKFIPITVSEDMVGHKFGEFAPTRQFSGHTPADKKAKQESEVKEDKKQWIKN